MPVEIKWSVRLQGTFSSHPSASWDMPSCGGCEQIPLGLCCDTLGWWWGGSEGRGKCSHFSAHVLQCPSTFPQMRLLLQVTLRSSCTEIFLHNWGVVFSAWENCCGLACTPHTMQTRCCQEKTGFKPLQSALDEEGGWATGAVKLITLVQDHLL